MGKREIPISQHGNVFPDTDDSLLRKNVKQPNWKKVTRFIRQEKKAAGDG
jgi:hypothetical protein